MEVSGECEGHKAGFVSMASSHAMFLDNPEPGGAERATWMRVLNAFSSSSPDTCAEKNERMVCLA